MYLCEIMSRLKKENIVTCMRVVYAFDAIILNACILPITYTIIWKTDWLWGLLVCNLIAITILRQYVFGILNIHWLSSPLNRISKRLTDIICSFVFLTTLFPLILFAMIIFELATRKSHEQPMFSIKKVKTDGNKEFSSLVFSEHCIHGNIFLEKAPLFIGVLIGYFSLGDLPKIQILYSHNEEKSFYPEEEIPLCKTSQAEENLTANTPNYTANNDNFIDNQE